MGVLPTEIANLPSVGLHPSAMKTLSTRLTSLGTTALFSAPPAGVVRVFGVGEGTRMWNESPNTAAWQIRGISGASDVLWEETNHNGDQESGVFRPLVVMPGDAPLSFEFNSGVAPDLNLFATWTDVALGLNQATASVPIPGTTFVKLYENVEAGTIRRVAALPIGGESAIEPTETMGFYNIDQVNHSLEIALSPDDGITFYTISRDSGAFRSAFRVEGTEPVEGIVNGESIWVRILEVVSGETPFVRVVHESIPEKP